MPTRAEIIDRARTLWPVGTVPYSQEVIGPNGYRQDCSGFVSMCWAIPPAERGGWGGQSTVTLVTNGYMREIPSSDLQPGDAVGICGPGTPGGAGHIVLFEGWVNDDPYDDRYWAYEQCGGTRGPLHRIIEYPYDGASGSWRAWRYTKAVGGDEMLTPEQAKQLGDTAYTLTSVPVIDSDGNATGGTQPAHNALAGIASTAARTLQAVEARITPQIDYRQLAEALLDAMAARRPS